MQSNGSSGMGNEANANQSNEMFVTGRLEGRRRQSERQPERERIPTGRRRRIGSVVLCNNDLGDSRQIVALVSTRRTGSNSRAERAKRKQTTACGYRQPSSSVRPSGVNKPTTFCSVVSKWRTFWERRRRRWRNHQKNNRNTMKMKATISRVVWQTTRHLGTDWK